MENVHKGVTGFRSSQKRVSTNATESDEMKVTLAVSPFQRISHWKKARDG